MCITASIDATNRFIIELRRIEHLHPDRRWYDLEQFGPRRPIAEMYLGMHRDRRSEFLNRITIALPTSAVRDDEVPPAT